ncbi:MAG: 50S ribosomal protein L3 [Alphaproteobacteria bacterium]|nr:50S ribosomal protein L3 [Alphaproteobacteria bacterium]
MRSGLIAEKIGMTQLFLENGVQVPVTVLKVEACTVITHKTVEKDGYDAIQVGTKVVAASKLNKPMREYFAKRNLEPCKVLKEFRVTPENMLSIGEKISISHFQEGQVVDVTSRSIGKGFAGAMKRHGFGGLRASHGVSVSHRSHGSTGNRQDPGKVFKNKKMAGHMGDRRVTKLNLHIQAIDQDRSLIFIKGSVPGAKNSLVFIRDAIKCRSKTLDSNA